MSNQLFFFTLFALKISAIKSKLLQGTYVLKSVHLVHTETVQLVTFRIVTTEKKGKTDNFHDLLHSLTGKKYA